MSTAAHASQCEKPCAGTIRRAFTFPWRDHVKSGNAAKDATRRQFLPIALEVQETPASPVGRWLLCLFLSLFVIALGWACFGKVDIVVSAPGRIVPNGQVKQLQAPQAGTIASILVAEGDRVEQGQPLIRLDTTYADADDQGIREQLEDIALQSYWRGKLEAWLATGRDGALEMRPQSTLSSADQARADALYGESRHEFTARMRALEKDLAANRAEQDTLNAEKNRTEATLAVLVERVSAYKALLDKQYGARVQYLEMLQQQIELERSIPILQSRQHQLRENAFAISARREATASDLRKQNLMELLRLDGERGLMEQKSRKTKQNQQQQLLTAPVTGTVQELAVHTVGGVVAPAQELMKIVPENVTIEVETQVRNKDIGFLHEGQLAEIKIDTFNFTKYGLIGAEVVHISNDAVKDEELGWVFNMRLVLDRDSIAVGEKRVKLSPGMAITAEIKTGKRRLIEFFLSPLLRYRQESVRER